MDTKYLGKETLEDIKERDESEYKKLIMDFSKLCGNKTFNKLVEVTIALYLRRMLETRDKDEMLGMQQGVHALGKLFDVVEGANIFRLEEEKLKADNK